MNKINFQIFEKIFREGVKIDPKIGRYWDLSESHLWYLEPSQSQGFIDITFKNKEYIDSIFNSEVFLIDTLLKKFDKIILNKIYNIIDLGAADGRKAKIFIEKLDMISKLRYCPVDISSYMINKCLMTMKDLNLKETIVEDPQYNLSKFENFENVSSYLRSKDYKNHLILVLGNTFGNFDSFSLLNHIKSGMKKGDILVIGNGIFNGDVNLLINSYKNKEIDLFLSNLLFLLGLDRKNFEYEVIFRNSRIEIFFVAKCDMQVSFEDKTIVIKKEDRILTGISNKYLKKDFEKVLSKNFDKSYFHYNKEKNYCVSICK